MKKTAIDLFKNVSIGTNPTQLPEGDLSGIKLRECIWTVKTAGPSPYNNERTELFFLGCQKAIIGHPCKGCFNSVTWNEKLANFTHDPIKMATHINKMAPHKYVTIGGGEPLDQIDNLIILCKELKKYDFHIMIYTWRQLNTILIENPIVTADVNPVRDLELGYFNVSKIKELLKYVDIVVDGQYKEEERLWNGAKEDGLISSIGSGNQIIWDIKNKIGYPMRSLKKLKLSEDNKLTFELNDNANFSDKINLNV